MAITSPRKKNPAAVALGRKGGQKGGAARAARLTPEQRTESARHAVRARWDKARAASADTSDEALLALLKRLKQTRSQAEVRRLTGQIERVIFHKQYESV
jgi:hypothetical protein